MKELLDNTILIEGRSGAGKTTAAQLLATRYGYKTLNSGTIFRSVAAAILLHGIHSSEYADFTNESSLQFDLEDATNPQIAVSGIDVSDLLQIPRTLGLATIVGNTSSVQGRLENIFDDLVTGGNTVVEGKNLSRRFIVPESRHYFLTATHDVRSYRKWQQALAKGDASYTISQARQDTMTNDFRDQGMLTIVERAQVLDTSNLSPHRVVECIARGANLAPMI